MRTVSETVDIQVPPSRVWAVMTDVETWPEWTPSMTSVHKLDAGPLGVGSRVRVKQPKLAPAVMTVTAWDPDRGFDWVTKNAAVTALARHTIEPADRGCRVTLSVTFSGPLAGLITLLYGGLTRRYIRMEAEGLQRRAHDLELKPEN